MQLCTYLLPIRRSAFCEAEARELANYFSELRLAECEVLVIDGSDAATFALHSVIWASVCRHHGVDQRFQYLNGKVNGILTGVEVASNEKIVLADDDVRYTRDQIQAICNRLDHFEVIRPQNFFSPMSCCARIEAARMLINRACLRAGDYPGTCAFRRRVLQRTGEYDGDVLFDNEEILRHFARYGSKIEYAVDFFVRKTPPRIRKWIEQRPRQAYEDFPLRPKTVAFASILPAAAAAAFDARTLASLGALLTLGSVALAYAGWRRGTARRWFPVSACLCAPLWILERSISTYVAFGWYLCRGGYPFGRHILSKGVGRDWFAGARIGRATNFSQLARRQFAAGRNSRLGAQRISTRAV